MSVLFVDGLLWLVVLLLVRVECVSECCISSRVCMLFCIICVHFRCIQCVVTSDGVFVFVYCLVKGVTSPCDWSVYRWVYVSGRPGFDSTSPLLWEQSQPGRHLAPNKQSGPYLWGQRV